MCERQQFEARVSKVQDILQHSALIHLDRHECNEIATLLEHLAAAVPSEMSKQLEREAKQMRGAVEYMQIPARKKLIALLKRSSEQCLPSKNTNLCLQSK